VVEYSIRDRRPNPILSYPDNLIPAFTFAVAIKDIRFQDETIGRIYGAARPCPPFAARER
jgi:hypothetical protein